MANSRTRTDPRAKTHRSEYSDPVVISIPVRLRRAGKEMRLVVDDGWEHPVPDPALVRLVIRAHGIRDQPPHDRCLTLDEIAKSHGLVPSYATRLCRLTLLAPDIIAAVLGGLQPPRSPCPQVDGRHAPAARLERAEARARVRSVSLKDASHAPTHRVGPYFASASLTMNWRRSAETAAPTKTRN